MTTDPALQVVDGVALLTILALTGLVISTLGAFLQVPGARIASAGFAFLSLALVAIFIALVGGIEP